MQDTHITEGDALSNEVEINLDMLRTLMLNRVRGEINRTNIVTIDNGSRGDRKYEVPEARPQHGQLPCTQPRHWSERQLFVF